MCRCCFHATSSRLVVKPCARAIMARQRICGDLARNTTACLNPSLERPPACLAPSSLDPVLLLLLLLEASLLLLLLPAGLAWNLLASDALPAELPLLLVLLDVLAAVELPFLLLPIGCCGNGCLEDVAELSF